MSLRSRRLFATAILLTAAPAASQTGDPARAPVQLLSDGLLATMKAGSKAGFRGRFERIQPVVDRVFDLPLMTRLAIGPGWTKVASADRTALIAAFRRMTIAQYADNFDGWSGQSFVVAAKVDARGADRLVRTSLVQPKESPVSLAYRLRQSGGQWRIIDVFYQNAISQLATRRADFARILATGGARALIAHLDALANKSAR